MAVTPSSTYVTLNLSKFREFLEAWKFQVRFLHGDRLERLERSEAVERLERLERLGTERSSGTFETPGTVGTGQITNIMPDAPHSSRPGAALYVSGGRLRNDGEPQGAEVRIKRERRHVIKERGYNYK